MDCDMLKKMNNFKSYFIYQWLLRSFFLDTLISIFIFQDISTSSTIKCGCLSNLEEI